MKARTLLPILLMILSYGDCMFAQSPKPMPGADMNFDRSTLREEFKKAVENDFDVVADAVATGPHGYGYWLVTVQPKRAGNLLIRHTAELQYPENFSFPKDDGIHREYRFTIGEKNQQRVHYVGGWDYRVYPLACLGDKIVIPIRIHKTLIDHTFSTQSFEPNAAKTRARFDAELHDLDKALPRASGRFSLRNNTPDSLQLVKTNGSSSMSCGGNFYGHILSAVFKVTREGKYSLRLKAMGANTDPPPKAVDPGSMSPGPPAAPKPIPIVAVPNDAAVTVLANRCRVSKYRERGRVRSNSTDYFDIEACPARVGDLLVVQCLVYNTEVTAGAPDKLKHPTIVVDKVPFSTTPVFHVQERQERQGGQNEM